MTKKIKKILIANRGEIACRVMKTARKMGIKTVAVYSDADKKALHTRMADEAVHIGASPAAESYLVIDKIINACKQTGVDAVHPGYGFLSENPGFVRACDKAGITFIGPKAESMEAMGLKDAAKKLMVKAGVPVTPGYHGEDQTPDLLKSKAGMIGYPVLIKAVAGGGGKGMRKVEKADDFIPSLESCQREAKSSFGDDRVLIEKYITSPRHIEVQVFGDTHGNVVHMYERDCSLQRRHQKVIEEAPAPGMTDDVRKAMTDAAIEAAKAVDYIGAGTVEFIVDGSGTLKTDGFWFMEMNTRLQVEHPVSEMITGLDFVELQIRVAQGEALPKQDNISMSGHVIEARVYAEDPANDFLPSIGRLEYIDLNSWTDGDDEYRVDTGIESNSSVSIFYDPMIAKAITLAKTRMDSIQNLRYLLHNIEAKYLNTNAGFLEKCLANDAFQAGNVNTHFIPNNLDDLIPTDFTQGDVIYAQAAILDFYKHADKSSSPFSENDGFRINHGARRIYEYLRGEEIVKVELLSCIGDEFKACVDGKAPIFIFLGEEDTQKTNEEAIGDHYAWATRHEEDFISFYRRSQRIHIARPNHAAFTAGLAGDTLAAPMPGKIIAVNTAVGDTVKAGDPLIIMEAMKMEMTLEAPRDGVVAAVNVESGALVSDGDVLLEMEADA